MNSTAPEPNRSPTANANPRGGPPVGGPAPAPAADDAICTPVLPPRICIPFPVIEFACGNTRYRTRPVDLVAEAIEGAAGGGEDGGGRMEKGVERGAWSVESMKRSGRNREAAEEAQREPSPATPSSILHPPSAPQPPRSTLHAPRSTPSALLHPPSSSLYSLRKGLGVWHLVFEGREAVLRPERGLLYVAWLLQHPPAQPLHAIDLAARIPELYRAQLSLSRLPDPATGQSVTLEGHARLQERSLALDDAQSLRAGLRRQRELEALLEDDSATEPEKAEALRELEALAEFERQRGHRSRDAAERVVRTVRQALKRLCAHLARAVDAHGAPHPVLRPFAEHLRRYVLVPSSRYDLRGNRFVRTAQAGCFTYEPPPGVRWSA